MSERHERARPIELHIDCLSLHGLAVDDAESFAADVRASLATLVERGGIETTDATFTSRHRSRPRPVTIDVPPRAERPATATHHAGTAADRELAHRVAEGVYRSLGGRP